MSADQTILATENEIVEEFSLFDSWDDKYEYIIDLGKTLPALEDQYKIDDNKVRGCQSTVWLVADNKDGKVFIQFLSVGGRTGTVIDPRSVLAGAKKRPDAEAPSL